MQEEAGNLGLALENIDDEAGHGGAYMFQGFVCPKLI